MLNASQRNRVDKLMLKMKKLLTPSACMVSSGPRPGDHTQRGSNVSQQWSDRAQINRETLGVDFTSQKCASQRKLESSANLEALMHDVWTQPVVLVAEMTDKACESSSKSWLPPLLPLHLRRLSFGAFGPCQSRLDNIGAAHELVPLDQRGACQQINPLGSW